MKLVSKKSCNEQCFLKCRSRYITELCNQFSGLWAVLRTTKRNMLEQQFLRTVVRMSFVSWGQLLSCASVLLCLSCPVMWCSVLFVVGSGQNHCTLMEYCFTGTVKTFNTSKSQKHFSLFLKWDWNFLPIFETFIFQWTLGTRSIKVHFLWMSHSWSFYFTTCNFSIKITCKICSMQKTNKQTNRILDSKQYWHELGNS